MKRIIIDADTGVDDSLAILYALRSPNFHVEGITTCFGNNNAEQSADNCLRLIRLSGCGYEVPVAVGSNESLDGVFDSAPAHIHGDNGIGNVELPESSQKPVDETAWDFIIRKAGELKDELTIITTGRMTNLARALEKDPELPSKVKKVVAMGGTLKEPGNVNPYAEANIHGDAKAADREFHRVSMGMAEACVVHDPLAVLIAEDPSLGVFRMVRAGVEYEHEPYRGMIKTDTGFVPVLDREEIAVCVEVDSEKAVRRLFSLFQDMTPGRYNRK